MNLLDVLHRLIDKQGPRDANEAQVFHDAVKAAEGTVDFPHVADLDQVTAAPPTLAEQIAAGQQQSDVPTATPSAPQVPPSTLPSDVPVQQAPEAAQTPEEPAQG